MCFDHYVFLCNHFPEQRWNIFITTEGSIIPLSSQLNHHPFPSTRQLRSDFCHHSWILLSLECRINRTIHDVFFSMDVVLCVDFCSGRREVVLMCGGAGCQADWSPGASGGWDHLREKNGGEGSILYKLYICKTDTVSIWLLKWLGLSRGTKKADVSQLTSGEAKSEVWPFSPKAHACLLHTTRFFFFFSAERVKKDNVKPPTPL